MAPSPSRELPPLRGTALVLLTIGVALATFMEVLDLSIVNVSVYTIAGNLGVSRTEGTMAISAYSLGQSHSATVGRASGARPHSTRMLLICSYTGSV